MEGKEDYRYLEIRDAVTCINQKVCLFGVVYELSFPRETRGTDLFCSLRIIDASHPEPGISVNVFGESVEKLPCVAALGDIIQLNHVTMKVHDGEVYALFNKRFSQFALYDQQEGGTFHPYQCSLKFRPRNQDSKLITGLRKWLFNIQLDKGIRTCTVLSTQLTNYRLTLKIFDPFAILKMIDSDAFKFLREIKEKAEANLACKVLHVFEAAEHEFMALVWDGTDSPPVNIMPKSGDEMEKQLPLQLEPVPLPRDLLCTFPTVGTILRVRIAKGIEKHLLPLVKAGKWVKLLNVLCQVQEGIWCGQLSSFSRLRFVRNEDHLKLRCHRSYDERLSSKSGRAPYWFFPGSSRITEVDYEHPSFVTLMDALTYSEVVGKFKCVARVVATLPWHPKDFISPRGIYRIRLTIEDPTARIHTFLYGEDGEKFFDGYLSVDELTKKRNKLLGIALDSEGRADDEAAPRSPPWLSLCLKSYHVDDEDPWGSRQFRIFATKLLS